MCLNYVYYSILVYYNIKFKDVCWLLGCISCIVSKHSNASMLEVPHVQCIDTCTVEPAKKATSDDRPPVL